MEIDSEIVFQVGSIIGTVAVFIVALIISEQLGGQSRKFALIASLILFIVLITASGYMIAQRTYSEDLEEARRSQIQDQNSDS